MKIIENMMKCQNRGCNNTAEFKTTAKNKDFNLCKSCTLKKVRLTIHHNKRIKHE